MFKKTFPLMVFCTLLVASGQYLLKKGISHSSLINFTLIAGLIIYGLAALLLIFALNQGKLSTTFPLITLSYLWVALIGFFFLQESLTLNKILGMVFISAGLFFLGQGEKK